MKRLIVYFFSILLLLIIIASIYVLNINNFKREGSFKLSTNTAPIEIHRDAYGIPYVIAENKADVIRGQGFVTAQDRLFQIEYYRLLIKGTLAEVIGASMLPSDIKMRVLDLPQKAEKGYAYLDQDTKDFLKWYAEGFNEYIKVAKDEFPVELGLLGIEPSPITSLEILSVIHFIGFTHGQDMGDEILKLNLAARTDLGLDTFPLNLNPDRTKPINVQTDSLTIGYSETLDIEPQKINSPLLAAPEFGSNNWAVSPNKSATGQAIVCNDPHLDARLLPGIFHPVGLFCPEFKGVGIAVPGIPGILVGRNEFVAFGVTNAYGDSQDIFIENTEGDYYFDAGEKLPFEKRKAVIKVKDSTEVEIEIRSTVRGPIISDFDVFEISTTDIISLQWSQDYSKSNSIGVERFLEAKNIFEFREALKGIDNMFFNYTIGDVDGNIAHQTTGLIPQRENWQQVMAKPYNQTFKNFIPKDSMPHTINPSKNWVGTANHDVRPDDYPYYYSMHFSPNYRYLRMREVLDENKKFNAEELWQLILDCKSMQAEKLSPLFVEALNIDDRTKDLAIILKDWNYETEVDEIGVTVYNVLYHYLTSLILNDELPDELEDKFWEQNYYWMQRMDDFILSGHAFIDNRETPEPETLEDLIIEAGIKTKEYLTTELGDNTEEWTWAKIHTVYFASPIRPKGSGKSLLGYEEFPKNGANQTINRGMYLKTKELNFDVGWFSTFRMVADLGDTEKFMGVHSGGNAARILHPYYKSQLETWKNEKWISYWISKDKVLEHSKFKLVLE